MTISFSSSSSLSWHSVRNQKNHTAQTFLTKIESKKKEINKEPSKAAKIILSFFVCLLSQSLSKKKKKKNEPYRRSHLQIFFVFLLHVINNHNNHHQNVSVFVWLLVCYRNAFLQTTKKIIYCPIIIIITTQNQTKKNQMCTCAKTRNEKHFFSDFWNETKQHTSHPSVLCSVSLRKSHTNKHTHHSPSSSKTIFCFDDILLPRYIPGKMMILQQSSPSYKPSL